MKIVHVVGARPNFMKIAPIMAACAKYDDIESVLVHTGQHYDEKMSDLFFRELGIPKPDINLGIGGGTHAEQTAAIMTAFEPVVIEQAPDAVLVVGDVNSTIATGLVAVKLGIQLIHVEAGLRSGDRSMPEEINRILTDAISDQLFCTEQSGVDHLLREGVDDGKIHLVGNVMIDTLLKNKEQADRSAILEDLKLRQGEYAVLTLHRPSNVDDSDTLDRLIGVLELVQNDIPVIFPIHPRTRKNLAAFGLSDRIEQATNLHLIDPIGYLDFMKLMANAKLVLTDSGGIQEETTILKVPCLTLRENTERPITIEFGTCEIVGTDSDQILSAYNRIMTEQSNQPRTPPLWDGKAAERIVDILRDRHSAQ